MLPLADLYWRSGPSAHRLLHRHHLLMPTVSSVLRLSPCCRLSWRSSARNSNPADCTWAVWSSCTCRGWPPTKSALHLSSCALAAQLRISFSFLVLQDAGAPVIGLASQSFCECGSHYTFRGCASLHLCWWRVPTWPLATCPPHHAWKHWSCAH